MPQNSRPFLISPYEYFAIVNRDLLTICKADFEWRKEILQGLRYSIIVEASETICDGTEGLCIVLKILSKPKPFLRFAVKPLSPAYEVKNVRT